MMKRTRINITDKPENDKDPLWEALLETIKDVHPEITDHTFEAYYFQPVAAGLYSVFFKGDHTLECCEKKLAQKKEPLLERLKSIVFPEYIAKLVDIRAVREEFDRINYQTPVEPHYGTSNGKLMACAWKKPQEEWEVFSALDMDVFLFVVGKLVASECDMAEIKAVLDEMGKLEKPREIGVKASVIYLVLKRHNISLQFSFSRKWEVIWNGLPIQIDSVKENFFKNTTTQNN